MQRDETQRRGSRTLIACFWLLHHSDCAHRSTVDLRTNVRRKRVTNQLPYPDRIAHPSAFTKVCNPGLQTIQTFQFLSSTLADGHATGNARIESFNGRFREECLNVHWFESREGAETKIEA